MKLIVKEVTSRRLIAGVIKVITSTISYHQFDSVDEAYSHIVDKKKLLKAINFACKTMAFLESKN